jgi:hypothetical protein
MAKAKAAPVATPMDLIWNDGVVPAWLGGMTVAFIALFPILRTVFPKTCKQRGAFLLAFELVAAVPVRRDPRIRGARADRATTHSTSSARRLEPRPRHRFSVDARGFAPRGNAIPVGFENTREDVSCRAKKAFFTVTHLRTRSSTTR